ncbi:MAG TPA: PIN domain-containing protein [Pyrinomonadaceae bacterium]|nr:PIN domain-containing protein [Pyrinomonadaceae bacterium]
MNSLDANVILRYLLRDIPDQAERSKRIITTSVCYVSDVIITEVAFVLERSVGLDRQEVAALIGKFVELPTVVCNESLLVSTIKLFAKRRQLSFPDSYAAVEARRNSDKLLTFDSDLIKFGGEHVKLP